jgi:molecular chaperone DnaK
VTFDIDANGIVSVSAKDLGTGTEQSIKIEGQTSLSEEEIRQKITDAEEFAEEDKRRKMKVELRNTADSIVYQTRRTIDETKDKLTEDVVNPVLEKLKELESMIINDDVPVSDDDLDEDGIQSRIQELEELMHKLSSKLYEAASAEMAEEDISEDEGSDVVEADFEVLDSDEE